ncbi:hypothetical protein N39L_05240 [Limnospira platensis NIES-39]|nr:hypothetical protein APPUASWS_027815 [Arthrospira platensis str. Paraca]BDT10801.1 hypothetical protein N39L_05240 [Arthrospira platensis NIES-39]
MPTSHGVDIVTAINRSLTAKASLNTTMLYLAPKVEVQKQGLVTLFPLPRGIYIRSRVMRKYQARFGMGVGEGDFPLDPYQ